MTFLRVRTITSRPLHSSNTRSAVGESTSRHRRVSITEQARDESEAVKSGESGFDVIVVSGSSGLLEACRRAVNKSSKV